MAERVVGTPNTFHVLLTVEEGEKRGEKKNGGKKNGGAKMSILHVKSAGTSVINKLCPNKDVHIHPTWSWTSSYAIFLHTPSTKQILDES
ncbi:hypothetical protein CEXT_750421 [Caerostris extrusa]|uniref:Uncharacterized protein n=1 Tax=Caerostris extrusa TaxID=172846 RepID=A0AAV4TPN0_CAEEX|nr:hypothetical protein CEXT_750421 [Caerostris extrusa]